MNIQRLRNLTTERLHTKMDDIYEDIEYLVGENGLFSHQIPNAYRALLPWLREKVTEQRFWNGQFDETHVGEFDISPMTKDEQSSFWKRFSELPSPLFAQ